MFNFYLEKAVILIKILVRYFKYCKGKFYNALGPLCFMCDVQSIKVFLPICEILLRQNVSLLKNRRYSFWI